MKEYLAICSRQPGNELIAAECKNLTGGAPGKDGIAICERVDLIPRAAFVQMGLRIIAQANTLEELAATVARIEIPASGFRIDLHRSEGAAPLDRHEAIFKIANALQAYPNLDTPQHRFLLLARHTGLLFCEILTRRQPDYQQHTHKPYHTSSSLPAQLARGMVNLVSPPARSLLDPCCGTGSILLEAQALGLEAFGCDLNPRMVGMARKNLAFFGYRAEISRMDAQKCRQTADAVVADLPYGQMQIMDQRNIQGILTNCAQLAPVGVFASGMDISAWLEKAGYHAIETYRVRKRNQFSRYVHRARSIHYR